MSKCKLPSLGIGTFQLKDAALLYNVIDKGLESGIRLIDTAQCYKNEELIGNMLPNLLKKHSLNRSEIIIVSKLDPKHHGPKRSVYAVENTLKNLGGYVDVMLIHWPGVSKIKSDNPIVKELRKESWKVLETFHQAGNIGVIGVSNYTHRHLVELMTYCTVKPSVLQNEFHPRYIDSDIMLFCQEHDITLMGYSPFGQGDLLQDKTITRIADKYHVTASQVLIKWCLEQSVVCIPRTSKPERVVENFMSLSEFELDKDDMKEIRLLNDNHKYCWDPAHVV